MDFKGEANWHQMFHDLIGDFDVKKLASKQGRAMLTSRMSVLKSSGWKHPT
jgi:hypothetical protein